MREISKEILYLRQDITPEKSEKIRKLQEERSVLRDKYMRLILPTIDVST